MPYRAGERRTCPVDSSTSDVELGKLAAAAKPNLLVTSHFVGSGAVKDSVIAAIRRQGSRRRIVIGKDLDRF